MNVKTDFIDIKDFTKEQLLNIFKIANEIDNDKDVLKGKTIVLFFPNSSIRTRVTFEK